MEEAHSGDQSADLQVASALKRKRNDETTVLHQLSPDPAARDDDARVSQPDSKRPKMPVSTPGDAVDASAETELVHGLPVRVWRHILSFAPPVLLGRLIRVSRSFLSLLDPVLARTLGGISSFCNTNLSEATWLASKARYASGLPQNLKDKTQLEMWKLLRGRACQLCGAQKPLQLDSNDQPWSAGPGADYLRVIWAFGVLCCGSCLSVHSEKEMTLFLSASFPSFLLSGLPYCFVTQTQDCIPVTLLQSTGPAPSDVAMQKSFFRPHLRNIEAEFTSVKELGPKAAEDWTKGLEERGQMWMTYASRWEQWDARGGLQKVNARPAQRTLRNDVDQNTIARHIEQSVQPIASPGVRAPVEEHVSLQSPSSAQNLTSLPVKPFQPLAKHHARPIRSLEDANAARALRRAEIERRCSQLQPPITPEVLQHMDSFRAALQIATPLDDAAWTILRPRLESQRQAAQGAETNASPKPSGPEQTATSGQSGTAQHDVGPILGSASMPQQPQRAPLTAPETMNGHQRPVAPSPQNVVFSPNFPSTLPTDSHPNLMAHGPTQTQMQSQAPVEAKMSFPTALPASYASVRSTPLQPPPQTPGFPVLLPGGTRTAPISTTQNRPQAPPLATPGMDLYHRQLSQMAQIAREIWFSTSGIKDIPSSVRIFVVVHHVVTRFETIYTNAPSISMFIDGLDHQPPMRPVRNLNGLLCKTCIASATRTSVNGHAHPPTQPSERKLFTLPLLLNHFRSVHLEKARPTIDLKTGMEAPRLDWRHDMIDLPVSSVISGLISAVGMDNKKLDLIAAAFPGLFPDPLPQLPSAQKSGPGPKPTPSVQNGFTQAKTHMTAQTDVRSRYGISGAPLQSHTNGPRLQQITSTQSEVINDGQDRPGRDEYDPRRPAFTGSIVHQPDRVRAMLKDEQNRVGSRSVEAIEDSRRSTAQHLRRTTLPVSFDSSFPDDRASNYPERGQPRNEHRSGEQPGSSTRAEYRRNVSRSEARIEPRTTGDAGTAAETFLNDLQGDLESTASSVDRASHPQHRFARREVRRDRNPTYHDTTSSPIKTAPSGPRQSESQRAEDSYWRFDPPRSHSGGEVRTYSPRFESRHPEEPSPRPSVSTRHVTTAGERSQGHAADRDLTTRPRYLDPRDERSPKGYSMGRDDDAAWAGYGQQPSRNALHYDYDASPDRQRTGSPPRYVYVEPRDESRRWSDGASFSRDRYAGDAHAERVVEYIRIDDTGYVASPDYIPAGQPRYHGVDDRSILYQGSGGHGAHHDSQAGQTYYVEERYQPGIRYRQA